MDNITVIRLRIAAQFKAEVEAVARERQISVSALTRQALVEAVNEWRARRAPVAPSETGKEAA